MGGLRPRVRQASQGDADLARAALAMIEAGLADPATWQGDVRHFIAGAIRGWMEQFGSAEVEGVFGFEITVSTHPSIENSTAEDMTEQLFVSLYPEFGGHTGIQIGESMEALREVDVRLPSMFWNALGPALRELGLTVWDHAYALEEEKYGMWGDWIIERNAEMIEFAEDGAEPDVWPLPSESVPQYMKRQPVKDETVRRALAKVQNSSHPRRWWADRLLRQAIALKVQVLGIPAAGELLEKDAQEELYEDVGGQWPSLIVWFEDADALSHMWDMIGEDLQQGDMGLAPAVCWPMPMDPQGVRRVHNWARQYMAAALNAARIVEDLRYPDGVPLVKVFAREEVRV